MTDRLGLKSGGVLEWRPGKGLVAYRYDLFQSHAPIGSLELAQFSYHGMARGTWRDQTWRLDWRGWLPPVYTFTFDDAGGAPPVVLVRDGWGDTIVGPDDLRYKFDYKHRPYSVESDAHGTLLTLDPSPSLWRRPTYRLSVTPALEALPESVAVVMLALYFKFAADYAPAGA